MNNFMKKLSMNSRRFLALLLTAAMVTGALPASTVTAAEASVTGAEDASALSEETTVSETTVLETTVTEGTGDGADSNLIQYTIDTTEYEAWLKDRGCGISTKYGTNAPRYWSANYYARYITVLKNGEELCTLENLKDQETPIEYTAKWQVKKDGKYEDLAEGPGIGSAAGSYKLVLGIAAVENVSLAMEEEVLFEVTPLELTPIVTINNVEPGTLVKDVVAASASAGSNVYVDAYNTVYKSFKLSSDAETSQLSVALEISDAYSGEVLSADTALLVTGDYNVKITTSFTDKVEAAEQANYTFAVDERKLQMAGLIEPEVQITMSDKWKNNNGTPDDTSDDYYNDYTLTFDGEVVEAPEEKTDYTYTVRYWDHYDYEKNEDVWVTITPAEGEITYAWYASENTTVEMEEAPVNAGTYYFGIKYAGQPGLYAAAESRIKVVVEQKKLTLVPKWKENVPTFYPGMSEEDVLDYIDYDAVDENGNVVEIDRTYIWGNYNGSSATFSYEPVFKLQTGKTEGESIVWTDNNSNVLSDTAEKYRVIFTGNKAVYYLWGGAYRTRSINNYSNNADSNYVVNVDTETLEAKVVDVTVAPGIAATIDVSALRGEKIGATNNNPITKTYDGEYLFAERAEYKVAKAVESANEDNVLASDVDSRLTYTWYRLYNDTYYQEWLYDSPVDAGKYMLEVSYQDPENVYHAEDARVFYEIQPQKIKVVPTQVPSALTETDVADYDYAAIEYAIVAVTDKDASHDGEDVQLSLTEGIDYAIGYSYISNDGWGIQEATAETPDEYNYCYGTFTKGNSYRVAVTDFNLYNTNYVDYEEVTEGTGEDATTVIKYLHETAPVELLEMGSTELVLTPDATKLGADTKTYDGEVWDISEAVANGLVKVTKKADNSEVSGLELDYHWYYGEDVGGYEYASVYYAGTYTLGVSFAGNTEYHSTEVVKVATVTITPADLYITPVVNSTIVAGDYYYDAYMYNATGLKIEGVASRDAWAFTYGYSSNYDYYAFSNYYFSVKNAEGNNYYNVLSSKETYTLTVDCSLSSSFASDYNVIINDVEFTVARGNSTVEAINYGNIEYAELVDEVSGMDHVIKPTAAVPFSYSAYIDGEYVYGNYVAFEIYRPMEYANASYNMSTDASFENSIVAAGGHVLYKDRSYISVAFDASEKDTNQFAICWEPGYVENFTVDFAQATLLADLRNAVDAKSLALNSPAKKMVVGATQQLDVKITQKQVSDTVYLGYSVDKKDVLCVTDYGYITALKPGKATVTVYCATYDYTTGEAVAIAGAKTVKLAITVTDVSTPKIKKVYTRDDDVTVEIAPINDGYRREAYILEGKNVSAGEFESRIAAMEQGHWEAFFAAEPVVTDYNSSKYSDEVRFDGLTPNTDYTVYVRNVSAVRTATACGEKCQVAESVKGATKSFKTTKQQVSALDVYYNEKQPVTYNTSLERYEVKLTSKSVTVSAQGRFWEGAFNSAAESYDYSWYDLPLNGALKKSYVAPKLTFCVAARTTSYTSNYYTYQDGYYYYPTSYATMAKNGKMTLKSAGTVYVGVYDSVSGIWSAFEPITITASPDKITANKVNLKVGQSMSLTNMVTYYEGKTKLSGSFSKSIVLDEESMKAINESEYFELSSSGTYITAIKAGGKLDNLTFTDVYCGATTKVSIKSADLAAAKSLKTTFLADTRATMSFSYDGYANYFKVEVIDGRNRLVSSDMYYRYSDLNQVSYNKGKYTYEFDITGLVKSSKYTVRVTAVYQDIDNGIYNESKLAKKAIKTTKIPVSYENLDAYDYNTGIEIFESYGGNSIQNYTFRTGNSYTLMALGDLASSADTLTWTSSDKKVATVKANAGGTGVYSAELKALKAGYTTIEVKSKITKKVVARYQIYVAPVYDGSYFSGDQLTLQSVEAVEVE